MKLVSIRRILEQSSFLCLPSLRRLRNSPSSFCNKRVSYLSNDAKTDFGFQDVNKEEKEHLVSRHNFIVSDK